MSYFIYAFCLMVGVIFGLVFLINLIVFSDMQEGKDRAYLYMVVMLMALGLSGFYEVLV